MKQICLIFLAMFLFVQCQDDDTSNPPVDDNPTEASVDDATIEIEEIFTPPEDQIVTEADPLFVTFQDKIYVLGYVYIQGIGHAADIWEFTPETNTYVPKMQGCENCSWAGSNLRLFTDNHFIYHINIADEPYFNKFSPSENHWDVVPGGISPALHLYTETTVAQNKAYFLGGMYYTQGNPYSSNSFTSYNFQTGQWVNLSPYIEDISNAIMVYDGDDFIYAMGGREDHGTTSEVKLTFARYSIAQNHWEQLADMPNSLTSYNEGGDSSILYKNRYIIIANFPDAKIHIYDTLEEKWKQEPIDLGFNPKSIHQIGNQLYLSEITYHQGTGDNTHRFYKLKINDLPD